MGSHYTPPSSGGGATITSPDRTLAVGGSPTNPTLDLEGGPYSNDDFPLWNGTTFVPTLAPVGDTVIPGADSGYGTAGTSGTYSYGTHVHPGVEINVLDPQYGVTGNGTTDDAAALQTAINATPAGGTVSFPKPTATYLIGTTLLVPSSIRLRGPGRGNAGYGPTDPGIITMKAGSNLDAMIASPAWYNNGGGIDGYITIEDMVIDPNAANQTGGLGHGIALSAWRCRVANNLILLGRGESIYVGTVTRNGSNTASGNAIENYIWQNTCYPTTTGIATGGALTTDNWIIDNAIIGVAGGTSNGIVMSGAGGAGNVIRGNHIYNVASHVVAGNVSLITIVENYLEPSNATASSGIVTAISVQPVGNHNIINGNKIVLPLSTVSGTTFVGINIFSVSNSGAIAVTGNTISGGTSSSDSLIKADIQSGSCSLSISGNSLLPSNGAVPYSDAFPPVTESSPIYATAIPAASTAGFARFPSVAGSPTGVPADVTQGIPALIDTTDKQFWFYSGGWQAIGSSVLATPSVLQQSAWFYNFSSPPTPNLPACRAGNTLILVIAKLNQNPNTVTGGPSGITWTKVSSSYQGTTTGVEIWEGTGYSTSNGTVTPSIATSGNFNGQAKLIEISGALTFDAQAAGNFTGSPSESVAVTGVNDIVIAVVCNGSGNNLSTPSLPNTFYSQPNSWGYAITNPTTGYAVSWVAQNPGSDPCALAVASFKAGAVSTNQVNASLVTASSGFATTAITSGSLPTVGSWVSGTAQQINTERDVDICMPVTYTPTSGAAATCAVALSPDNTTYSTVGTESVPLGTALDSFVRLITLRVPAGWWIRFTVTNGSVSSSTLTWW